MAMNQNFPFISNLEWLHLKIVTSVSLPAECKELVERRRDECLNSRLMIGQRDSETNYSFPSAEVKIAQMNAFTPLIRHNGLLSLAHE
jgi:hypothetical protein